MLGQYLSGDCQSIVLHVRARDGTNSANTLTHLAGKELEWAVFAELPPFAFQELPALVQAVAARDQAAGAPHTGQPTLR